jgi:AraC-like DNA-binding protein
MHPLEVTPAALPPTAIGGLARLAVARARASGLDPVPLLHRAGLTTTQIEDKHARMDVQAQVVFVNLIAEALGDGLLGYHLAQAFELREAGLLYFALASSATLKGALERAERYSSIANEGVLVRCLRGGETGLRFTYVGVPRHIDRHQIEFWATTLVRMARQVTMTELRPVRATLIHPRCRASDQLEAFFGCAITFGADRDEIAFSGGAADLPLTGADPYLNDLLVQYGEKALAHRARPAEALRTRVENAITPLLPHGKVRVGDIAAALGLSRRTLARQLAAEDLTVAAILDEMRADLALHYLRDASLSISRIAWLLGFQEVSAFSHAFKRWTGQTPSQTRSRHVTDYGARDGERR